MHCISGHPLTHAHIRGMLALCLRAEIRLPTSFRPTLATRGLCSVSRVVRSLYRMITNLRTRVSSIRSLPDKKHCLIEQSGEKARICAAGGFVDFGRVNGNLALSRAIGDFEFKKSAELSPEQQIVTAYPDVITHTISDDDEFLVIACDGQQIKSYLLHSEPLLILAHAGIWDCQSSQAVVEFVRRGVAAKQELHKICENMMDNCLAPNSETGGVGCDNMTMIIIGLLQGKSKEEWYKQIADRVANGDGPCAPPEYGKSESASIA